MVQRVCVWDFPLVDVWTIVAQSLRCDHAHRRLKSVFQRGAIVGVAKNEGAAKFIYTMSVPLFEI